MKSITYNLNLENCEDYYLNIRKFTSKVIYKSETAIGNIIHDFQSNLLENPPQNVYINEDFRKNYNYEEHVFELLFLGIIWKNYIEAAINLDPFYQKILANLVDLRNQKNVIILEKNGNVDLKEKIDEIRGFLVNKHLLTDNIKKILHNYHEYENNQYYSISKEKNINFNIKNYDLLLNYLKAIGDYEESLKHLHIWRQFFQNKQDKLDIYFKNILSFTNWFFKIANDELNGYTANVDNFRENQLQNHAYNEDILFCARNESEYFLNMFGSEVMNRVFRYKFEKRDKTAIILPKCMKLENNFNTVDENNYSNDTCKNLCPSCNAIKDYLGLKCIHCNQKCNIGQINKVIKEKYHNLDINVYISTHNSTIISNITKEDKEKLSIVGIACINNLIEGGWKISSFGIPAQCVILDYVGCEKHWDNNSFPTNFNVNELNRILSKCSVN